MSDWRARAKCAGKSTDIFFPPAGDAGMNTPAKRICAKCPVRVECLEYALTLPLKDTWGVWGGLSQAERIRLYRARKAGTAA